MGSECPLKRRQEWEAAKEKRQQEQEARKAAMQKTRCHRCYAEGHLARDCPQASKFLEVRVDDQVSVRSESTVASGGDLEKSVQVPPKTQVPTQCGFCGAKRTEPKSKRCRDRCQSCFRPFNNQ